MLKSGHFSGKINTTLPSKLVKDLRRYYYAAVSYTDSLVGKVSTGTFMVTSDSFTLFSLSQSYAFVSVEYSLHYDS